MSVIVLVSVDCLSDCLFFQGGFLNLLIYLQCHRPESTKLLGFDIYLFKVSIIKGAGEGLICHRPKSTNVFIIGEGWVQVKVSIIKGAGEGLIYLP